MGMSREQQDLVNRIFTIVERLVSAYEYDVATRRMLVPLDRPHVSPADVKRATALGHNP